MSHIANVRLYAMEHIIHLSSISSLSILSSSYAHFEKLGSLELVELEMFILVISHALNVA